MGKITAITTVTLDGVMQAPGHSDEDRRGGFAHGGWAAPYGAMAQLGGGPMGGGAMLFGRRTWENFYAVWPKRKESPFSALLDNMRKYVASRTLKEPLAWQNSILLKGDAADAVAKLKAESGDLVILGSGELVRSLMPRKLVDEFVVLIHPLVLGSGRRLYAEGREAAALRLVSSRATDNGVVIATYRPA